MASSPDSFRGVRLSWGGGCGNQTKDPRGPLSLIGVSVAGVGLTESYMGARGATLPLSAWRLIDKFYTKCTTNNSKLLF